MGASLRADLRAMALALAPYLGSGAGAFHPVKVAPCLKWAMVPRRCGDRGEAEARWGDDQRKRARIAAVLAGAFPPPAGLVEGGSSDATHREPRRRQGLCGLSAAGGFSIENLCAVIREDRGLFGMWTVTLPVEAAEALNQVPDGFARFQDAIRRRFSEEHARACARESQRVGVPVEPVWGFVVEPQKSGRPHMHFVFRCKSRRRRPWLLGKGRLDRLIRAALRTVLGQEHSVASAGNVQALRSSPGAYLSKYLRKGAGRNGAEAVLAHGWTVNLVPFHWWGWSRSARRLVMDHTFEMPSRLVGWLSLRWRKLVAENCCQAVIWQPEDDRAPSMVVGQWRGPGGLLTGVLRLVEMDSASYPSAVPAITG